MVLYNKNCFHQLKSSQMHYFMCVHFFKQNLSILLTKSKQGNSCHHRKEGNKNVLKISLKCVCHGLK